MHLHRCLKLLASVVFLLPCLLYGFDDWQPVTPEDLKLTSADAGNADAIILYHQQISDDNRAHRQEYIRLKILTENGKRYADVEIPYSGDTFEIVDVKARTISPDGTIVPGSPKVYDRTVVKAHGVKVKMKTFTFSDVKPGSIIEWRYTRIWEAHYFYAARWILQEDLVQRHAKFVFIPYKGSANIIDTKSGNLANIVYWSPVGLPKGVAVKESPDSSFQLEMKDIPAYEQEAFSPPADTMKMRVEFYYGGSSMAKPVEFWKDEGKYWSKEVDKFIGHSSAVAQAAGAAVTASDTPEQKVHKLYDLVQKLKNTSYQPRGLQEIADDKSAPSAEQILQRNEGSRDEITRLFVALVRAVNIPAYVMRVGTRDSVFFQQNIPNWRQLNSEVAIVHLADGKDLFLDPGTRFCPFGLLEWTRTSVQGVRQTANGSTELAQTPEPDYKQTVSQRIGQLKLREDGALTGQILLSWTGQEALSRRIDGGKTDEAGRTKALEDDLKALLPAASMIKLVQSKGWDQPNDRLQGVFNVEIPSFATSTGKRLILPTALFEQGEKQPFVHQQRKNPVYFSYPYRTYDNVQMTLPSGLKVESLPQKQSVNPEFGIYTAERTQKGNMLELRRDFAIGGFAFQLSNYPELKSFYEKMKSGDEEQIVLQNL